MFGFGFGKIGDGVETSARDTDEKEDGETSPNSDPPWLKRQRMSSSSGDDTDLFATPASLEFSSSSETTSPVTKHSQVVQVIWYIR